MNAEKFRINIERTASRAIFIGLLLFPTVMILPVSGKSINNIAYVLIALPSLILAITFPKASADLLRKTWPLWIFFLSVFLVSVAHQQFEHAKAAGILALFSLAVFLVLDRHPKTLIISFTLLASVSTLLLAWNCIEWLQLYLATGGAVRLTLWGHAQNPIYAGLLLVCSFTFIWQHYTERLPSSPQRRLFALLLLLLCLAATVVFQARTALIGLVFCLVGWLYLNKQLKYIALPLLLIGLAVVATGSTTGLLERGLSYRPEIWHDALTKMNDQCNLFLGCGQTEELFLNQFKGTHNGYLGTVYRHGIIAGLALFLFAAWYFIQGLRKPSSWFVISLVGWGGMLTAMDGFVGGAHAWWAFLWVPTIAAIHETLTKTSPDLVKHAT